MLKKAKSLLAQPQNRCYAACAVIALSVVMLCAITLFALRDNTPRFEMATTSSEINFDDPAIRVHTADDGVAIVGAQRPIATPVSTTPPRMTADPATIWQGEAAPAHTHGGFTLPVTMDGEAIGVLTIPDIGLSVRVYEGEDYMGVMDHGVWHFRHTSAWYGNTGLSAHNVNLCGSPGDFLHLYRLRPGAVIHYQTVFGTREYAVETLTEICQYDWSWLGRTEDNRLTLITCITGRPELRLVVQAVAVD